METSLSTDLSRRLLKALDALATDGALAYAALINASGNTIGSTGHLPARCGAQEIAALGSDALVAMGDQEERIARGEEEGLLRKDSESSFYLHPLGENFLLLSVGNPSVRAGLVRLVSRLHAAVLQSICREIDLSAATESAPEAPSEQPLNPWVEFDRISVNDLVLAEKRPSGGFLRLRPGDIDTALSSSTSSQDAHPDEQSGSLPRPETDDSFRHVFSRMLTEEASRS